MRAYMCYKVINMNIFSVYLQSNELPLYAFISFICIWSKFDYPIGYCDIYLYKNF